MMRRANTQAAILRDFQTKWRHKYLTSLREYHKASDDNIQQVKRGDIVLVHDDVPRATWRMAVIEELIVGQDGLTRAAAIRTSTGTTSRPITRLYRLELSAEQDGSAADGVKENSEQPTCDIVREDRRPKRATARRAAERFKDWAMILSAAPPPPGGCRSD